MATLTVTQLTLDGVDPGYVAADAGGDEFPVDTRTIFTIRNGDASPITVTIASQLAAVPGLAPDDAEVTVPATDEREVVFQPAKPFADANSLVQVTYSAVTSVTVAARRC